MTRTLRLFALLVVGLPLSGPSCSSTAERTSLSQQHPPAGALARDRGPAADVSDAVESPPTADEPAISPVSYADASGGRSSLSGSREPIGLFEAVPTPAAAPLPIDGAVTGGALSLAALEEMALRNNPSIRQANATAAKAAGIQTQVGLRPNPSIGYFGDEIGNEGAGGLNGAFVQQTFVMGDKLGWSREVVGHELNALMWQVDVQRQRVRTDVRIRFYAALVAQRRLELARDFRAVAEKGVRVSEDRLRILVGSRPDLLQSQIQLNEVDLLIQRAELDLDAAWTELAATIGIPHLSRTELAGDLNGPDGVRDGEAVYLQIVASSPLLAAARARVDRARANLQLQQQRPIPNLTAQLGAGHDDATGDEFANVQLSLPLPLHNRNQGNIGAAQAEYCEATQNVQRLMLQIRRDLAGVLREYRVARVTVDQYESSILPKAGESLELIEQAQQVGQINFLRVLTARRMYFDANLEYVRAQGNLAQAEAKLDGLLLTGGLENVSTYDATDDLRGQALNIQ